MIDGAVFVLTLVAALGSGLVAGVFFAFSTFVMRALGNLPAPQGITAMQSINVAAVSPLFMALLLGTALTCLACGVVSVLDWGPPYAGYLLAGSLLYLLGPIALTIGYHVPRNDALARVDAADRGAASHWARYVSEWTAMNHVRTVSALAAAGAFIGALNAG